MQEFYGIIEVIVKFRHYLLGHKFLIRMNQHILKNVFDQSLQTSKQQVWLNKFGYISLLAIGYVFTIEYKPNKKNLVVDAFFTTN